VSVSVCERRRDETRDPKGKMPESSAAQPSMSMAEVLHQGHLHT